MSERRRRLVLLGVAAPLALAVAALAGCAGQGETEQRGRRKPEERTMRVELVEQWAQSGHARPVTFAAEEEGCKNCHDGLTYTQAGGGFQPRFQATEQTGTAGEEETGTAGEEETGTAGEEEQEPRDYVVATDCRACHTEAGVRIAEEGQIEGVPNVATAEGGFGALCMSCHNGWHEAGARDGELGAPHASVQTDMLYGVNVLAVPESPATQESDVESESPHLRVEDTCVGCHVSGREGPDHTFAIEDFEGCEGEGCHEGDMTDGGEASEDFDGDGQTERYAAEIEGLLESLEDAINESAGSTSFTDQGGNVVFEGGARVTPDDPAYAAAYNYFYVIFDSSRGMHNPKFAAKLLRDSLDSLNEGGTGGGTGGGTETTGTGEGGTNGGGTETTGTGEDTTPTP